MLQKGVAGGWADGRDPGRRQHELESNGNHFRSQLATFCGECVCVFAIMYNLNVNNLAQRGKGKAVVE